MKGVDVNVHVGDGGMDGPSSGHAHATGSLPRGGALGPEWVSKTGLVDDMLPGEVTAREGSLRVSPRAT